MRFQCSRSSTAHSAMNMLKKTVPPWSKSRLACGGHGQGVWLAQGLRPLHSQGVLPLGRAMPTLKQVAGSLGPRAPSGGGTLPQGSLQPEGLSELGTDLHAEVIL